MHLHDAIRLLYGMLMKHGLVSVHHLGTFALQKGSAEFTEGGTKLTPPYTSLSYSAVENNKFSLSTLLTEEGDAPDTANIAERVLSDWFVIQKERGEEALLPGFGKLTADAFVPVSPEWFNAYHGLQEVEVPKVMVHPVGDRQISSAPGQSQPALHPFWKSSFFWISAAVVLLLVLIAILWMPHAPSESPLPAPVRKTRPLDTRDSLTGDAVGVKSEDQSSPAGQVSADPNLLQCTIIVGAFKVGDNAEKMKEKIKQQGFPVFEEKNNGFTRVGLILECDQQQPDLAKATARKFNREAWLLRHK